MASRPVTRLSASRRTPSFWATCRRISRTWGCTSRTPPWPCLPSSPPRATATGRLRSPPLASPISTWTSGRRNRTRGDTDDRARLDHLYRAPAGGSGGAADRDLVRGVLPHVHLAGEHHRRTAGDEPPHATGDRVPHP